MGREWKVGSSRVFSIHPLTPLPRPPYSFLRSHSDASSLPPHCESSHVAFPSLAPGTSPGECLCGLFHASFCLPYSPKLLPVTSSSSHYSQGILLFHSCLIIHLCTPKCFDFSLPHPSSTWSQLRPQLFKGAALPGHTIEYTNYLVVSKVFSSLLLHGSFY